MYSRSPTDAEDRDGLPFLGSHGVEGERTSFDRPDTSSFYFEDFFVKFPSFHSSFFCNILDPIFTIFPRLRGVSSRFSPHNEELWPCLLFVIALIFLLGVKLLSFSFDCKNNKVACRSRVEKCFSPVLCCFVCVCRSVLCVRLLMYVCVSVVVCSAVVCLCLVCAVQMLCGVGGVCTVAWCVQEKRMIRIEKLLLSTF